MSLEQPTIIAFPKCNAILTQSVSRMFRTDFFAVPPPPPPPHPCPTQAGAKYGGRFLVLDVYSLYIVFLQLTGTSSDGSPLRRWDRVSWGILPSPNTRQRIRHVVQNLLVSLESPPRKRTQQRTLKVWASSTRE